MKLEIALAIPASNDWEWMNGGFQVNIKLTLGQRLKFAGRLTPSWINPYSAGTVFRRQNLTYKNDPRTERKMCIMAVNP